jgi:very-short-patch-repair endonuclease
MKDADEQIAVVAELQFGVFGRQQAADEGLSEYAMSRRVMTGRWVEIFPGVYRLPGTTRTGRQRAMAAVLWGGDKAAISHTTAGRLLRLDAIRFDGVHLTLPPSFGRRASDLVLHRMAAAPVDLVVVDGIRCTSATRTIVDCAGLLGDEALEVALESPLEVKLARLLRKSSLPKPHRQAPVGRFRLDFAWPSARIACECDGFEHHGARLAWKRDRRRLAAIEATGWRIVQVTWADVTEEPDQTIDRLSLALRAAA